MSKRSNSKDGRRAKERISPAKTRNSARWTEARFRGFVVSALRSASRRWPPKYERLADSFIGVRVNKKTGRQCKHYSCAICKEAFPQREVQVDHKDPIGSTSSWDEFIEKLFCEKDNLQVVCKPCHKAKTKKERASESKKESGNT